MFLLNLRLRLALIVACLTLLLATHELRGQQLNSSNSAAGVAVQSDATAVQAFRNVLVQSGGAAAWVNLRSTEEVMSVSFPGKTTSETHLLLDDWSQSTTRYRRKIQGQHFAATDHNGTDTFTAKIGTYKAMAPEYDQARALVGRLPAAAAEIMLRRSEYVLKSVPCEAGFSCIGVFRGSGAKLPHSPEQYWRISSATGLPATVRIAIPNVTRPARPLWKETHYAEYQAEGGLVVPTTLEITGFGGGKQTWTFKSLKANPGFDTAAFDQEVAQ